MTKVCGPKDNCYLSMVIAYYIGLTHLNLVCSPGPSVELCALCIANSTSLDFPIDNLLILFYFILFSNVFFCILVHE